MLSHCNLGFKSIVLQLTSSLTMCRAFVAKSDSVSPANPELFGRGAENPTLLHTIQPQPRNNSGRTTYLLSLLLVSSHLSHRTHRHIIPPATSKAKHGITFSNQTPHPRTKIPSKKSPNLSQNHRPTQRSQHPRMVLRPRGRLRSLQPLSRRNILWQTCLSQRIPL